MKASELIEKLQKAIDKVGDVEIMGVITDDFCGGAELFNYRYVSVTNRGNIVVSQYGNYDDAILKFEEIK